MNFPGKSETMPSMLQSERKLFWIKMPMPRQARFPCENRIKDSMHAGT